MYDIVFVYPPVAIGGRYKRVATGHEVQPQPLIYPGSYLHKNGFSCTIIDANALGLDIYETVSRILALSPRYVGITSATMLISASARIAREIKRNYPGIITIVGGPHITAVPKETMALYSDIDIGVLGEGEITTVELLNALSNKIDLASVDGIIYRKNGNLALTETVLKFLSSSWRKTDGYICDTCI